jgi:hypothetical protein
MVQAKLSHMSNLSRGYKDESGRLILTDDCQKPYVLRTARERSQGPMLRFSRRKPRYRRVRGVLVMMRRG